jgi:hypothetical protein
MFDRHLSKDIFDEFMNGKVINKHRLNNAGQDEQNPYFTELMENLDDYKMQYDMSGLELVVKPSYALVREVKDKSIDLKTDISMKCAILLMILGKFVINANYRMSKLTEASGGITVDELALLENDDDVIELLEKGRMKGTLSSEVKNTLVGRKLLLEIPGAQKYILSDAGRAFFDEVVQNYIDSDSVSGMS